MEKLNLLNTTKKFDVKSYWRWTCIRNKLSYKNSFYFKLFTCLPDGKRPKFFYEFTSLKPHQRNSRPPASFYKIWKLNLCLKTGISKTAWINTCTFISLPIQSLNSLQNLKLATNGNYSWTQDINWTKKKHQENILHLLYLLCPRCRRHRISRW